MTFGASYQYLAFVVTFEPRGRKPIKVSSLICDVFEEIEPTTIQVGQVTLTEIIDDDDGQLPF